MQPIRKINAIEIKIIQYFVKTGSLQLPSLWYETAMIQPLNDGGMGSFLIFKDTSAIQYKRKFGKQIGEYQFVDEDGIVVIVSLNVDQADNLFEVDIWKTNYNPVIRVKIPL